MVPVLYAVRRGDESISSTVFTGGRGAKYWFVTVKAIQTSWLICLAEGRWAHLSLGTLIALKCHPELSARTKCSLVFSLNIWQRMGASWHLCSSAFLLMQWQALLCPFCSSSFFLFLFLSCAYTSHAWHLWYLGLSP